MKMESSGSEEDVFEVEQIVDHVAVDGDETYYRVRWKSYGPDSDTWEPKDNLLSCEDLLKTYIKEHVKKNKEIALPLTDVIKDAGRRDTKLKEQKKIGTTSKQVESRRGKGRGRGRGRGRGQSLQTKRTKVLPNSSSSSSSENDDSDSSSSDEPHVKDSFWEDLEKGKIDVLSGDLYSKVKRRRVPVERFNVTHTTVGRKRGPKRKESVGSSTKSTSPPASHKDENNDSSTDKSDEPEAKTDATSSSTKNSLHLDLGKDNFPKTGLSSPVLEYIEAQLKESKVREKAAAVQPPPPETTIDKKDTTKTTSAAIQRPKDLEISVLSNADDKESTDEKSPNEASNSSHSDLPSPPLPSLLSEQSPTKNASDVTMGSVIEDFDVKDLTASIPESSTEAGRQDDVGEQMKSAILRKLKDSTPPVTPETSQGFFETEPVPETPDAFSMLMQGLDSIPTLTPRKEKPRRMLKATLSREPSKNEDTFPAETSHKPDDKISTSPPSRNTDVLSVFESLEQEFGTRASSDEQKEDKKIESSPSSTEQASPPTDEPSTTKDVSGLGDMAEFLKVKVNFFLDEISLREIEQHHEAGEPPCRVDREVSNEQFRKYVRGNQFDMVFEVLKLPKLYNLEHQDSNWLTQLMMSSASGYSEVVKVLAHYGARVNAKTKTSQTALMFAAEKGHSITVRILLLYGAYVNLQTTSGDTALIKATKYGKLETVRCLLQAGTDPCLRNSQGVTATSVEGRNSKPCISLIKKYIQTVDNTVNSCIKNNLRQLGLATVGPSLFGIRTYNLREQSLIYFNFPCNLTDVPPNQGVLLFAVHGFIGSRLSLKCRMRGPCYVSAIVANNAVMEPIMPVRGEDKCSHFITNLVWRNGNNSVRLFLPQDALCKEKLYVIAYVVGFSST